MPRTLSSRDDDDAASPIPDAMMLSQSITRTGRCLCRPLDRDGGSRLRRCGLWRQGMRAAPNHARPPGARRVAQAPLHAQRRCVLPELEC
uniref:Uncharacterized protein n=1 Tax=Setaria viridis TaxID=4556 RepID=A0A4U6STT1_SETVI|nr:hypothetical protein SEVIR_9G145550v2 [Setaria viridis]